MRTFLTFSSFQCKIAGMLRVVLLCVFMVRKKLRAILQRLPNCLRMSRAFALSCFKTRGLSAIALEKHAEAWSLFDSSVDEVQDVSRIFDIFFIDITMSRAIRQFLLHSPQNSRSFLRMNIKTSRCLGPFVINTTITRTIS